MEIGGLSHPDAARRLDRRLGSEFLTGGLPGRGMLDSHAAVSFAVETAMHAEDGIACVSEDQAKAFDSISPAQALAILLHLGLHPRVARIIMALYLASRRIFTMDGAVSGAWISTTRSLLQGCPFSALLYDVPSSDSPCLCWGK